MSCKREDQQYQWCFKIVDGSDSSFCLGEKISLVIAETQAEGWQYVHAPQFLYHERRMDVVVLAFRRKDLKGANSDIYSGA